jgi:hypothetical protein
MAGSRRSAKSYTLAELLAAQGGPIARQSGFAELERRLRGSAALRRVRLPALAFKLLDEPRLAIVDIPNFRETYRVPDGLFLALFLELKWARRRELDAARASRRDEIAAIMALCPAEAQAMLGYLERVEKARNAGRPVWKKSIYPATKKRAREMLGLSRKEWLDCFLRSTRLLRASYRRIALPETALCGAFLALGCFPDPATGRLPSEAELKSSFRRRSKELHPDLGGDEAGFRLIERARDELLGELASRRRQEAPGR